MAGGIEDHIPNDRISALTGQPISRQLAATASTNATTGTRLATQAIARTTVPAVREEGHFRTPLPLRSEPRSAATGGTKSAFA
jgi:hypothetical protein